jgi:SAM-dependent methyltransferase
VKIDRRLLGAVLVVAGFGAGWFARMLVAPASKPAAPVETAGSAAPSPTTDQRTAAFDTIYKDATWGTNLGSAGTSGFGSMVHTTIVYRAFLETFMTDNNVHSVVDAGCGDWEFSQAIDWTGIDYKGYDIVGSVIDHDKQKYAKPNIQFFTGDVVETDLPPADLLIVKDVLQHLPNADVKKFLAKQVPKYKHVLLTNTTNKLTLTSPNPDIKVGEHRPLDLTRPPFDVHGFKMLTYWDGGNMHQVLYMSGQQGP